MVKTKKVLFNGIKAIHFSCNNKYTVIQLYYYLFLWSVMYFSRLALIRSHLSMLLPFPHLVSLLNVPVILLNMKQMWLCLQARIPRHVHVGLGSLFSSSLQKHEVRLAVSVMFLEGLISPKQKILKTCLRNSSSSCVMQPIFFFISDLITF